MGRTTRATDTRCRQQVRGTSCGGLGLGRKGGGQARGRYKDVQAYKDAEGRSAVKFITLFHHYDNVSDTLVGLMIRAEGGLIHYDGEMLLQGKEGRQRRYHGPNQDNRAAEW
jgi:hypothetical protein